MGSPAETFRPEFVFTRARLSARSLIVPVCLLLATLLSTTAVGVVLTEGFQTAQPLNLDQYFTIIPRVWENPALLVEGLSFSIPLMLILLAHEMGHYLACRYYNIDATLPFFMPAPTPIGTLGAFIKIKSPIYTRRALFDIGIAGPLAGFVVLLPVLVAGVALSKIIPGAANRGDLVFGVPGIQRLLEWIIWPGVRHSDIYLHPVGRAAWVGILATALNLLPIGQLDGGHILYAFFGGGHKVLSRLFIVALIPLGIFYSYSWLVWAGLLIFALRHPIICDISPLGTTRTRLGISAMVIFLLTFTLVPIH